MMTIAKKEAAHLIPEHMHIKPILHFMERDIWGNIMVNKIPYCILYERGYRSLGAASTSQIVVEGILAWEQVNNRHTDKQYKNSKKWVVDKQAYNRRGNTGYPDNRTITGSLRTER